MSMPNPTAKAGGDGTTNHDNENNLAKFKNADVVGHPAGMVFRQFASASGYTCEGAGTAFMPYLLSTLDTIAWRYNIPEAFYPEALIPGRREIGTHRPEPLGQRVSRGGFLHQTDDHKSGAVVAQRAGDIVTRRNQIHVYQPLAGQRPRRLLAGRRADGDRRLDGQVAGADAHARTVAWSSRTAAPACRPSKATTPGPCGGRTPAAGAVARSSSAASISCENPR